MDAVQLRAFESQQFSTTGAVPKEFPAKKLTKANKMKGPDTPLWGAICPLVYPIRVFGLAPYEFHNDILIPSKINSVYSFVCLVVYTYIIYTILVRFMGIEMEKPLLGHTETAKTTVNYLISIFDIIVTLLTKEKFIRIWNVLQDYDAIVKNLCYPKNETKTRLWAWIIMFINLIVWLAVSNFGIYAFQEAWLNNVAYMLVYVGTSVSVMKFSGLVMLLGQRFDHLNVIANKSGPLASRWLMASPTVDSKDIEYLHNMLMLASERLESLYSWSILLWLSNLCLHIVSDFYFLIQRIMMYKWDNAQWKILSCLSSWLVAFIGQLIFLNFSCHFASSEANCMGSIMINWRRWLKSSSRKRNEDVETSTHLVDRKLHFSAAGCFDVNLPLLRSIAGLLTTYLVILLQFQ